MLNSLKTNKKLLAYIILAVAVVAIPDLAAAGGITEFSDPLEKVASTVTGPAGKWIGIAAMGACGVVYILNKEDMSRGFQMLLQLAFGISFIAFASSIVNSMFSFSGAMI